MTVRRLDRKPGKPKKRWPPRITSAGGEGPRVDRLRRQADTPIRLIKDLNAGTVDPGTLTNRQRKAVLVMSANGKRTSAELGLMLGCPARRIRKLMGQIRREVGREVGSWTMEEVLGSMVMVAEKCSAMAMEQEDPQLAWAIERDKVKILRELGVVGPAGPQEGVRVTIEALGRSYERATAVLAARLDPRLTGLAVADQPGLLEAEVLSSRAARAAPRDPGPGG